MSKPKIPVTPEATSPIPTETVQSIAASTISDDEIRTRAFQIYESRDRNSNNPDEDWNQARTELTEMLGGK